MNQAPTQAPITFVLGAPRSGTTLFRVMLAGHPGLWSPPEMVLAPFETMPERREILNARFWEKGGLARGLMDLLNTDVEGAREAAAGLEEMSVPEVYAWLQSKLGGRMLVDKCPHLSVMPDAMARLPTWFPNARYLWISRHPGAVTRSLQNMPMAEVMLQGYPVPIDEVWRYANQNIKDFLDTVPADRWMHLRYEDLVEDGRPVLERVCQTLGLPFEEAMLSPYEGDRMREGPRGARAIGDPNMAGYGSVRKDLVDRWLSGYDPRRAGPETRALALGMGYDLDAMALPPIAKLSDAMDALWDTARELERSVQLPMDIDAVEARRFLLRIMASSVDTFVELGDGNAPEFHHAEGPTRKMFADNPDADYMRSPISTGAGQVYRVWGRVPPGTTYTGVLLYGRGGRVGNRLTDGELGLDQDGNFELRISKARQDGVWLQADGDETAVFVRQYYTDRKLQAPVELNIELLGDHGAPPPLTAEVLTVGVERARRMMRVVWERTLGAWRMASTAALNQFIEIPGEGLFPTPDNTYRVCWYRFGHDQLFFVRGKLPAARYFSFALYNVWLESLDYKHRPVKLNHSQIVCDADGNFEICLAPKNPGHPNWLDTAGHAAGYLIVRALLAEEGLGDLSVQVMYDREWNPKG